jgi:hypothetical protein
MTTPQNSFLKSLVLTFVVGLGFFSCSTSKERPTRLLIYASAALRAADRAGGERKAPDAYRKAESAYWKAKTQYQLRQYDEAARAAIEARRFAEMAEVEAETRGAAASQGDLY